VPRLALATAICALVLKLYLAWTTIGTNDVLAYWYFLQEYRGSGLILLYERDSEFNHPPFVIHWLMALRWIHLTTGAPPWFCLRLPPILADFGSCLIVARLLGPRLALPSFRLGLFLVAAAPVSVMVSGFHGNNDSVMMFFVLLSILLLERSSPAWLAGIAMGMAVNMKIVPLVFWPAFLLWLPGWRKRAEYFVAAVVVVAAASSPAIFEAPELLAQKVLGYKSSYGLWGISRLLASAPALSRAFESWGRLVLAGALVALAAWMNLGRSKPALARQIGVLALGFLALTPGFGVQYLAWLVPWMACVGGGAAIAWTVATTFFLVLVYTFWCQGVNFEAGDPNWLHASFWSQGLPWSFANANTMGEWRGPIVPVEIAAWLATVGAFASALRAAALERARG
jgi:hypothetical protein